MKFQANIPFKLTKLFYEKLGEQPKDKRILVIRDFFTAMHASIDNAVTFVTDDKEAYELFNKNVVSNDEFGNDDTVLLVDTEINKNAWKDFIKELSSMPKFDVAIMNPPYDKNLHLKILEAVIPVAEKVVNISPVRWLQDPLAKYKKNSDYNKFEESISKKIENLDVIDSNNAQIMFDSAVFCIDLGIYTIGKGGYDYTCNNPIVDKVWNHVAKYSGLPIEKYAKRTHNNYMLIASIVGGNGVSQNCFVSKPTLNYNEQIYGKFFVNDMSELRHENLPECKKKYGGYWGNCENWNVCSFATVDELVNFYNSTHTKFFKYVYWTSTVDVNVHPEFLPYMQDYTQPWTDKRFCEYFGITGYIDDEHAVPNSEWEIILNTMKEYV